MTSFCSSSSQITFTNGCKRLNTNTHGTQRDQWRFTWSNLQPLNFKTGMKVFTWLTDCPFNQLMSSKYLIPNINSTSTSNKQQLRVQPCSLMVKLLLSILCNKRKSKFTFTTKFSSQLLMKLLTTTVSKRANKLHLHLQQSTQTSLTWKSFITLEFKILMSFTWSWSTTEGTK